MRCPAASLDHKVMVNVKAPTKLTLIKGAMATNLDVLVTFPTTFMCNSTGADPVVDCTVSLLISTDMAKDDMTCLNGKQFPQIVMGVYNDINDIISCGVKITEVNWYKDFKLPVKAFIDGLTHRAAIIRNVYIKKQIYIGSTLLSTETISTIQVGSACPLVSIWLGK